MAQYVSTAGPLNAATRVCCEPTMPIPENPSTHSDHAEGTRIARAASPSSSGSGVHLAVEAVPSDRTVSGQAPSTGASCIGLSRAGWRIFRQGWTAWMVVATSLPYLWNSFVRPAGWRYAWILPPFRDDSYGYMAWSQQAAHGALLFKLKFTALPQTAFLFQPFFLVCGWASRLLGANLGPVHFFAKEVGVVLFFLLFYRYTDYLRLSPFQSLVASVLVGISSGVGGATALLFGRHEPPNISADLWMPEVSTFWSLLWNPLFPWSLALMLLAIYWLDRGTRDARARDLWLAGLAAGVLALIHPYSQALLLAFAALVIVVRRRRSALGYLLRYLLPLAPFVGYVAAVSVLQPVMVQHSAHGSMDSPSLLLYLSGFGLPLLIWAMAWPIDRGRWMKPYWQVVAWFGLSLALAYAPLWFQRKLIMGAHIPLCILAAIAFDLLLAKCASAKPTQANEAWVGHPQARLGLAAATVVLVPLLALTPMYLILMLSREVQANIDGVYYISPDMDAALKFMKQHSSPDDIVLATLGTSMMIPAYAGNTVVWGHWAMAVDADEREAWSQDLFDRPQNWNDEARARDFWTSGVEYIFADGILRAGIETTAWKWRVILKDADEVFRNDRVVIYKHRTGS
jgi:hypothetical protein